MDIVPALFDIPLHGLACTRYILGCDAFKNFQVLVAGAFGPVFPAEIYHAKKQQALVDGAKIPQ